MAGSYWAQAFIWTQEQINKLTKLYKDDGLTGMEVAEIMGISRNKVMGKLNRLGLLGDRGPSNQFKSRVILRVPRPPRVAPAPKKERAERKLPPIMAAPPLPAAPPRQKPRKSRWPGLAGAIDALRPGECRYPLGEPLEPCTGFCMAPVNGHVSYCEYHHYLAYKKPGDGREWYEDNPKRIKGDYRQWKPLDRGT